MTENSLMAGLCRAQLLADPEGSFKSVCAVIKPHLGSIPQGKLRAAASFPNKVTDYVKDGDCHMEYEALWEYPTRAIAPTSQRTRFPAGSWPSFEDSYYCQNSPDRRPGGWYGSFTLWGLNRHGLHLATLEFFLMDPETSAGRLVIQSVELARVTPGELLEQRSLESLVSNLFDWLVRWKKQRAILETQATRLTHDLNSIRKALHSAD